MGRKFDAFFNTVLDPSGISALGALSLDIPLDGWSGIGANALCAAACYTVRGLSETGRFNINPKMSMLVQAAYQLVPLFVTCHHSGFNFMAGVYTCAITGNILSAFQEKEIRDGFKYYIGNAASAARLPQAARFVRRTKIAGLFRMAGKNLARSLYRTGGRELLNDGSKVRDILLDPNIYWTTAFCEAGQSTAASAAFILGGSIAFLQPLFENKAKEFLSRPKESADEFIAVGKGLLGRTARRMQHAIKKDFYWAMSKKDISLPISAAGFMTALSQHTDLPSATAMTCWALCCASIYAFNRYHGPVQALRAMTEKLKPSDPTPA
jgi:hypothetical protein